MGAWGQGENKASRNDVFFHIKEKEINEQMVITQPNLSDLETPRGFQQACGGCPPDQMGSMVLDAYRLRSDIALTSVGKTGGTVRRQPGKPAGDERTKLVGADGHRKGKP